MEILFSFSNRSAGFFRLFFLLGLFSGAQVYVGSIDKYPVVFELAKETYLPYNARYFYKSQKQDIFLKREGDEPYSFVSDKGSGEGKEYFYLKANGEELNGNWKMGGKTFTVHLVKLKPENAKSNYNTSEMRSLKENDLYTFAKLEKINFKKTKEENWDKDCVLEWYEESLTKIEFFRIKSCNKIANLDALNKYLTEKHIEQVAQSADCTAWGPMGGEYSFSAHLNFVSDQFISIFCTSSYYCGGAHPDFGSWGINLDHRKIKELKLSDLYWFDDPKKYNAAYKGSQDDLMKNFGKNWNAIVKKAFPEEMKNNDAEGACNYDDETLWSLYSWCLNKEGLWMSAYFARAMRCCDNGSDWPIVPYSQIDKFRVNKDKYHLP